MSSQDLEFITKSFSILSIMMIIQIIASVLFIKWMKYKDDKMENEKGVK